MSSPVKRLNFRDGDADEARLPAKLGAFIPIARRVTDFEHLCVLAETTWPNAAIKYKADLNLKAAPTPLWNAGTPILPHLQSVRTCAEKRVRTGGLRDVEDFFELLFESIDVPHNKEWITANRSSFEEKDPDPRCLILMLLVNFHSENESNDAYSTLTTHGIVDELESYIDWYDTHANRIPFTVLSEQGRVWEFVKHLPTEVKRTLDFDRWVQQKKSLLEFKSALKRYVIDAGLARSGFVPPPAAHLGRFTPRAGPPPEPSRMDIDVLTDNVIARMEGKGVWGRTGEGNRDSRDDRGGRGGKGGKCKICDKPKCTCVKCFHCGGKGHRAAECPSKSATN